MFVVSEAEAAAIRAIFHEQGEFAAAIELRRLFPGMKDIAQVREYARTIAGWRPLPRRLRPGDCSLRRLADGDAPSLPAWFVLTRPGDRLTIQRAGTRCVVRAVGRPSVRRGLACLGRALLFPFQILTRELESSPRHCHGNRVSQSGRR
jgi:hypothetical protein